MFYSDIKVVAKIDVTFYASQPSFHTGYTVTELWRNVRRKLDTIACANHNNISQTSL